MQGNRHGIAYAYAPTPLGEPQARGELLGEKRPRRRLAAARSTSMTSSAPAWPNGASSLRSSST